MSYPGLIDGAAADELALRSIVAVRSGGERPEPWLTTREMAYRLSFSEEWVRRQLRAGAPHVKPRGARLMRVSLLLEWLRQTGGALPTPGRTPLRKYVDEPEWLDILAGDPCCYCGKRGIQFDHIEPRSTGGGDSWQNLTAACHRCNGLKRAHPLLTWLLHRI